MRYGYTYKITNKFSGKVYIGQHKSPDKDGLDPDYFCSSKNPDFWEDVRLLGKENFSVELLEESSSIRELNDSEVYWISYFRNLLGYDKVYNISGGGSGSWSGLEELKSSNPEGYKRILEIRESRRLATNLVKYGSTSGVLSRSDIREKAVRTQRNKNGGSLKMNSEESLSKSLMTNRRNHGGILYINTPEIIERAHNKESVNKRKTTIRIRYGNSSPFNTPEIREKIKSTLKERYGSDTGLLNTPEAKAKVAEKNKVQFVYEKGGEYKIMSRNAKGWKVNGYNRLCELGEWENYCLANHIDPNLLSK